MGDDYDVAVIGDAFIDVIAGDIAQLPVWNSDNETSRPIEMHIGGSAVNTALGLAALGVRVCLFVPLGRDVFAQMIRLRLSQAGVTLRETVKEGYGTGACVVMTGSGDNRAFLSHAGATAQFVVQDLDRDAILRSRHIHVGGYYCCKSLRGGLAELLRDARARGVSVSFDCNGDSREQWANDGFLPAVLQNVDIFTPNDVEALAISEKATLSEALDWFSERIPVTVITRGHDGVICRSGPTTLELKSFSVVAVDSTGGGDAFAAGFVRSWITDGRDVEQALRWGSATGAICVGKVGASDSPATVADVEALFAACTRPS